MVTTLVALIVSGMILIGPILAMSFFLLMAGITVRTAAEQLKEQFDLRHPL